MLLNFLEVTINDTVSAKFEDSSIWIYGVAAKGRVPYTWKATPLSNGFYVVLYQWSGPKIGEIQGATFNLGLEVAATINSIG